MQRSLPSLQTRISWMNDPRVNTVSPLIAFAWGCRSVRSVRRSLLADSTNLHVGTRSVPDRALGGEWGLKAALRLTRPNCLVRASVLQAWCSAHGDARDIVIGVTAPSAGFRAHAWLDGDPPCHSAGFVELTRRSPDR